MKKIVIITASLFLVFSLTAFSQNAKPASKKKTATETVSKSNTDVKGSKDQGLQQKNQVPPRPKLSKEDSLKRVHRLDSIRKVIAENRAKEGNRTLSKEDSLKRVHKIDSLKKSARERSKMQQDGPQPYRPRMSKEDSLKKMHKMDSIKKAVELRRGKMQEAGKPAEKK